MENSSEGSNASEISKKIINNWVDKENKLKVAEKLRMEKPFYRYMSIEKFFKLITAGEFVISSPSKWIDPYERRFTGAKYNGDFVKPATYAACFTQNPSNEAAWMAYSYYNKGVNERAVRLRLDTKLFFDELVKQLNYVSGFKAVYLGKIEYTNTKWNYNTIHQETHPSYKDIFSNFDDSRYVDLLMIKRHWFSHERECRLVVLSEDPQKDEIKIIFPPEVRNKLFTSVLLDPSCPDFETEMILEYLKNLINNSQVKLSQSVIYKSKKPIEIVLSR